ncbi:hypothetical protein Asp14428_54600 [Actinoplanes sp. NBRC 14428]|uniref:hypothetical protein n=1 Tax=Pseudosporangium ferrugineum TaxID=439699 RepID=UPI000D051A88|nr:hypothetical protein [Pseudosporangium ferrugineum]BCJ53985.1 hypothetical protein Asp14428_54600 [Actinoplanes sp. NBRC 14428]
MGTLVTLHLPPGSPVADLPWIITIGALDDEEEWEPLVCGPYERPHALALAQAVVADEELMAVVEPLLPLADADAIRAEVALAKSGAGHDATTDDLTAETFDRDEPRRTTPGRPPTRAEVRAGFARIAAKLTSADQ